MIRSGAPAKVPRPRHDDQLAFRKIREARCARFSKIHASLYRSPDCGFAVDVAPKITTEHAARHALLLLALAGFALAAFYDPKFWASVAFSALIGWLSLFKR